MMLRTRRLSLMPTPGQILAFDDLDLPIGENLLILGKSGCGKSTFLNMLSGLLRPASGNISFEDQAYDFDDDHILSKIRAQNFGFVFQRLHLLGHLTTINNICVGLLASNGRQARSQALSYLDSFGLGDKADVKVSELSVGEAQRVAIIRALVHTPKIIFADEPTSALDDHHADQVMSVLSDYSQKHKASLIVATHDARIQPYFTHIRNMTR
ncbi:MAG: ATP-binding cassette domain-containing protein [Alphaproteobacteria bacterium]|nr:ATP-binding cassette domain-containing protein [Alphaproteobacteria bacterium]